MQPINRANFVQNDNPGIFVFATQSPWGGKGSG